MKIFPSIDLLDQEVVRLHQGDFSKKTTYASLPPEALLERWYQEGAEQVHIVDLSGAKGESQQTSLLSSLLASFAHKLNIQVGGGVRGSTDISALRHLGAWRVVLGSLVVERPQEVHHFLRKFTPEHITLACDVRYHKDRYAVKKRGWQEDGGVFLEDLIKEFQDYPVLWLITDICRDGTLEGPNFALYRSLKKNYPDLKILVSGGVRNQQDLKEARDIGLWGCIIGKALHEGHITLSEALTC